jgi:zinc transport system permease protein
MSTLLDPLFAVPFANGLVLAIVLPLLGAYARLRGDWLSSLGIAQASAAGIVLGAFVTPTPAIGAVFGAALAASVKAAAGRSIGNDVYAVMLLAAWSATLLLAANTARGDDLARALLQGQLYFTGRAELIGLLVLASLVGVCLPWLSHRLLLAQFFPEQVIANGGTHVRHDFIFDLLAAVALAAASSVIGVMAAFAMVFVPPWVAFFVARGWRHTLAWSVALGLGGYLSSFALAIVLDQPYGPVLVATLLLVASGRSLARRVRVQA